MQAHRLSKKGVGHFLRKMDLTMNFREKLKKISPPHPQKKKQQKTKQKKQTQNNNTTRETQKHNNKQSKLRIVNQYTGTHKLVVTSNAQG